MTKARKLTTAAKPSDLFEDIRVLIEQTRTATARAVNSAVTLLYWQVGQRIRRDVLHEQRAEYGEQIVVTLSGQLTEELGRGWDKAALTRMMQFAERFSRSEDCCDAVATIDLEPPGRTATVERFAPTGLLR